MIIIIISYKIGQVINKSKPKSLLLEALLQLLRWWRSVVFWWVRSSNMIVSTKRSKSRRFGILMIGMRGSFSRFAFYFPDSSFHFTATLHDGMCYGCRNSITRLFHICRIFLSNRQFPSAYHGFPNFSHRRIAYLPLTF